MRLSIRISFVTAATLFVALVAAAADRISFDTIPLQHRAPEEVMPIVSSMMPGVSVESWDRRLIVRGTPEQMAEVRALVAELDRAPRQWLVHVRRAGQGSGTELQGRVEVDGGKVRGALNNPSQERAGTGTSTFRVLEGSPAVVRFQADEVRVSPFGRGDLVEIKVSVSSAGTSAYNSALTVKPGMWIRLGGVVRSEKSKSSDILARRSGESRERAEYEVKVVPVR